MRRNWRGVTPTAGAHRVRARVEASGRESAAATGGSFAETIEKWVERSRAKIRAEPAIGGWSHGYLGSERTTRRAVADAGDAGAPGMGA